MKNSEIKRTIKESRIMQYEIAAQMGISEYTLCKWFWKCQEMCSRETPKI